MPGVPRRPPPLAPPGGPPGPLRRALSLGARLLQPRSPAARSDAYVVGLHCAREDPGMQMEAHHFCRFRSRDFLQCAIYDGNTPDANLIGIEYIVSEGLHATLAPEERALWHPHDYEILSGQLQAPGVPERVERELMRLLMNSYGKTWHTWHTGRCDAGDGDPMPVGHAALMWSFNRDGEADEALRSEVATAMRHDEAATRDRRRGLTSSARPQEGVDLLRDAFPGSVPVPGVRDVCDRAAG